MILLIDLVRLESTNGMFLRSICTSLDQTELKINIHCNIFIVLQAKSVTFGLVTYPCPKYLPLVLWVSAVEFNLHKNVLDLKEQ